jgi:hypothetical protein
MKTLFLFALPIALAGSPAISATYSVEGDSTGLTADAGSSGDTPRSVGGGSNPFGYGGAFESTASNVNGGYASASASEGIANTNDYNLAGGPAIFSTSENSVKYTMEVAGPTTDALVPVLVTMFAHVDALSIPGPVGGADGFYFPIIGGSGAEVVLDYVNNGPDLPFVSAGNSYNYQYYTGGYSIAPDVGSQTDSFSHVIMIRANEPISVLVAADAILNYNENGADSGSPSSETATANAVADPTFTIEDPAFAAYTITGVPAGPAAVATPEPATWAIMLIGFAGLGYVGYQRRRAIPFPPPDR